MMQSLNDWSVQFRLTVELVSIRSFQIDAVYTIIIIETSDDVYCVSSINQFSLF